MNVTNDPQAYEIKIQILQSSHLTDKEAKAPSGELSDTPAR